MNEAHKVGKEIRSVVREYILDEFLEGEDPSTLKDDTSLMQAGILDSIASAKLVSHLETRYDVRFKPHEMKADHLDTVDRIVTTVQRKIDEARGG